MVYDCLILIDREPILQGASNVTLHANPKYFLGNTGILGFSAQSGRGNHVCSLREYWAVSWESSPKESVLITPS